MRGVLVTAAAIAILIGSHGFACAQQQDLTPGDFIQAAGEAGTACKEFLENHYLDPLAPDRVKQTCAGAKVPADMQRIQNAQEHGNDIDAQRAAAALIRDTTDAIPHAPNLSKAIADGLDAKADFENHEIAKGITDTAHCVATVASYCAGALIGAAGGADNANEVGNKAVDLSDFAIKQGTKLFDGVGVPTDQELFDKAEGNYITNHLGSGPSIPFTVTEDPCLSQPCIRSDPNGGRAEGGFDVFGGNDGTTAAASSNLAAPAAARQSPDLGRTDAASINSAPATTDLDAEASQHMAARQEKDNLETAHRAEVAEASEAKAAEASALSANTQQSYNPMSSLYMGALMQNMSAAASQSAASKASSHRAPCVSSTGANCGNR